MSWVRSTACFRRAADPGRPRCPSLPRLCACGNRSGRSRSCRRFPESAGNTPYYPEISAPGPVKMPVRCFRQKPGLQPYFRPAREGPGEQRLFVHWRDAALCPAVQFPANASPGFRPVQLRGEAKDRLSTLLPLSGGQDHGRGFAPAVPGHSCPGLPKVRRAAPPGTNPSPHGAAALRPRSRYASAGPGRRRSGIQRFLRLQTASLLSSFSSVCLSSADSVIQRCGSGYIPLNSPSCYSN